MMPSHEPVIDPMTVAWEFECGDGMPAGAVYMAAVIPQPPDESPAQQPGVVGPQHLVGLTIDRIVDLLASAHQDRYLRPERERLFGIIATSAPESPEGADAVSRLTALEHLDFPYPIYGCIIPGVADGKAVVGIIVFYTEKGGTNGNGKLT